MEKENVHELLQINHHTFTLKEILAKNLLSSHTVNLYDETKQPIQSKVSIQGVEFTVPQSYLMNLFENQKYLYILFACKQNEQSLNESTTIIMWQFKKKNGQNRQLQLKGIKGIISSMKLDMIWLQASLKKSDEEGIKKQSRNQYKNCLILGTEQGYLKFIDLNNTHNIRSTKLSTFNKITQLEPFFRDQKHSGFYLVLFENNQIQLINILNFDVILRFNPPILHTKVQDALSLYHSHEIHPHLIYQSTKGGYLIVWQLDLHLLSKRQLESKQNQFKAKDLKDFISPKFLSHELSLVGMLYMHVLGNLVMIVDKKCYFKVFSIDVEDRMDFVEILKVQLPYFTKNQANIAQDLTIGQNQREQQFYSENFPNTFINFKFSFEELSLYFMLAKDHYAVYKLKISEWLEIQSFEKIKVKNKHLKSIQQFLVSQNGKFLIVRNKQVFAIKYFEENCQEEQNRKNQNNRSKERKQRLKQQDADY